jgi:hypothetical protein
MDSNTSEDQLGGIETEVGVRASSSKRGLCCRLSLNSIQQNLLQEVDWFYFLAVCGGGKRSKAKARGPLWF